jgi:hypothetical protein
MQPPSGATSVRDLRHATNESVHRTANEHRHGREEMRCECECYRGECGSSFTVARADYEAVRAVGHRFLVAPGHESPEEIVVEATGEYVVIDKVGAQGAIADQLDPR